MKYLHQLIIVTIEMLEIISAILLAVEMTLAGSSFR